jgi:hypothetical protein
MSWDDHRTAGHHFINGICVLNKTIDGDTFRCGMPWYSIQYCTKEDKGKTGIAHTDPVNENECAEIENRKAEFDTMWIRGLGWR